MKTPQSLPEVALRELAYLYRQMRRGKVPDQVGVRMARLIRRMLREYEELAIRADVTECALASLECDIASHALSTNRDAVH